MDKIILKDFLVKYWKHIAIVVLILLLFQQCNKSEGLILDAKSHKAEADKYLSQARLSEAKLQGLTAKYDTKIDSLTKIENKQKLQLVQNSKIVKAKLSDLSHYSTTDNTNYFKDRYNETANVIQVKNGTTLKDTVSKKVITDLIIGDGAKAEVKILRETVKTKDNKFSLCNTTVDSLKIGIKTISDNYTKANLEKDKALNDTEKSLRHERNKKNFWKILFAGALGGAGYLLLK